MTEWKEYKLGEIAKFSQGLQVPVEEQSSICSTGKIRFVRIIDVTQNQQQNLRYIDIPDEKYIIKQGDIIMLRYGYPGVVADKFDGVIANNLFKITPLQKSLYLNKYLYYFLKQKTVLDYFDSSQNSTTMPAITFAQVSDLKIKLPPLDEQDFITVILSSLDDKIDLLLRENATLEQMAETLFRQWFVEDAKEEWKEGKLGDLIDVKSGFAFKSSSFVDFGLYRLITIKAVQDGYLTLENADYISEIPDNIKDYCLLKEGDILLSLTGNVGRCCLVDRERLLLNQRVALLCAKDNKNWAFVYTLFRMQSMKSKLEEMAKGTAQPNLSPIELSNMQFDIPPTKLLDGFSDAATPLLRKALSNNKQIQTLIQTRDGLLPRLMNNNIIV